MDAFPDRRTQAAFPAIHYPAQEHGPEANQTPDEDQAPARLANQLTAHGSASSIIAARA
jgi:hypothetical protein